MQPPSRKDRMNHFFRHLLQTQLPRITTKPVLPTLCIRTATDNSISAWHTAWATLTQLPAYSTIHPRAERTETNLFFSTGTDMWHAAILNRPTAHELRPGRKNREDSFFQHRYRHVTRIHLESPNSTRAAPRALPRDTLERCSGCSLASQESHPDSKRQRHAVREKKGQACR